MKLTKQQISDIAQIIGLDYARMAAFIEVESGGTGFDPATGKIIIQFEPTWFSKYLSQFQIPHSLTRTSDEKGRRLYSITANVGNKQITLTNGVEGQKSEWEAFNKAWQIHPDAAMLSTSIGLMQIMGFHFKALGFKTVGEMWDSFKKGEYEQVLGGAKFIASNQPLFKALVRKDWTKVAYYYNGPAYAVNQYDIKLEKAHKKYAATA